MSEINYIVTIPCRNEEEARNAAEEVWGGSMMWSDGKAYPVDEENPCIISPASPAGYQDLKDRVDLAESETQDIRNHAVRLADALMDINNVLGEDYHVKIYIAEIDSVMREYHGLEIK